MRFVGALSLICLTSCAATAASHRSLGAQDAATVALPGGAGRCRDLGTLASIEVYPAGIIPQRRYTLVAPVEAGPDASPTRRVARLQAEACSLGADAVVGWSEVHGRAGRPARARGFAVAYTDRPLAQAGGGPFDDESLWDSSSDL